LLTWGFLGEVGLRRQQHAPVAKENCTGWGRAAAMVRLVDLSAINRYSETLLGTSAACQIDEM
jgi:hypothetical protein